MFHCSDFFDNEEITLNVRIPESDLISSIPIVKYQQVELLVLM